MSRRKDRERFQRIKEQNPGYTGFRGADNVVATPPAPPVLESVVCSICNRRRNVAMETLPEDRSSFVCLRCQGE
ncbi:MAG: hypothetical protein OXI91_04950 [Chloroflexota bacterium]|nr:hypothetical protein [Chloroflexota bacterium]